LEDPALAAEHELDREPGEGGVRAAVADEPGEQRLGRRHAVDLSRVDGAEQHEQQQREEEDEERRLSAAPEDELFRTELVEEEAAGGLRAAGDPDCLGAPSVPSASSSAVSAR